MEYGKKYCPDSSTLEETAVQRAVVDAIQKVVNDDGCQAALKNLQLHMLWSSFFVTLVAKKYRLATMLPFVPRMVCDSR